MQIIVSFICGLMMSVGLIISGMVNPQKVLAFLDVTGQFDPTLAFVMAGALAVAMIGFKWAASLPKPCLCAAFDSPSKTSIDTWLVTGAAIFGIGWGLVGFCPAPVIVALGLGVGKAGVFIAAMLAGMYTAQCLILLKKV